MADFKFDDDNIDPQQADDELKPDTGPRKRGRPPKLRAETPARPPARIGQHGSLEGPIKATLMMVAATWEKADPVCGRAFKEAYPNIAQQLSLMADADAKTHEFVNNLLMKGGLGLFLATLPVVTTVVNHHITGPAKARREAQDAENAANAESNSVAGLG